MTHNRNEWKKYDSCSPLKIGIKASLSLLLFIWFQTFFDWIVLLQDIPCPSNQPNFSEESKHKTVYSATLMKTLRIQNLHLILQSPIPMWTTPSSSQQARAWKHQRGTTSRWFSRAGCARQDQWRQFVANRTRRVWFSLDVEDATMYIWLRIGLGGLGSRGVLRISWPREERRSLKDHQRRSIFL